MDKEKDRDKKSAKPAAFTAAADSESGLPQIGPHNPALGEIYQRLYPEIRRPKPNQEAIAAALQAMQRLTMEADSEVAVRDEFENVLNAQIACNVCGHRNRKGNKFCGACGLALESTTDDSSASTAKVAEPEFSAPTQELSVPLLADVPLPQAFLPQAPLPATEAVNEVHPSASAPPGTHHYHHHYHHHYFQGGQESAQPSRPNSNESAREADRLRVAAAAKGEPMSRGEAAVRRLTQEWVLACNTRQLDELIDLYTPDAMVLRANLPPIRGSIAVREFFFSSLEAGLGEVALDPMRVEIAGDLAHEVGRYSALVPGSSGKRREERGKYLWVFAKQSSGDWKLISECWSSDLTLTCAESDIPKAGNPGGSKPQPRRG